MHTIVTESDYGPNGRREALWEGFPLTDRNGIPEWIHRVRMNFCHITYYRDEAAESVNGPWDTIVISSRIPMHAQELRFKRTDDNRRMFFMTLDLLEDAYLNGQNAKAEEFRKCLGIKESR